MPTATPVRPLTPRRPLGPRPPRAPGPRGRDLVRVLAMIGRNPLEAIDHVAEVYGDVVLLQIFGGPLFIVRGAAHPFGGGRRVCVGAGFAMMEGVILAAMSAQRYTLDLIPGAKVILDPTITLRPLRGRPMTVQPRPRPAPG